MIAPTSITILQMKKQQYQENFEELWKANPLNQEEGNVPSSDYQKYQEEMKVDLVDNSQAIRTFAKKGIIYTPESPYQKFNYKFVDAFKSEALFIQSFIAHFEVSLCVLIDIDRANPFQKIIEPSIGGFGEIYFFDFHDEELAFKCILNKQLPIQVNFSRMIHELTIMKILSALECTVRLEKYLGYDAILYNDCYMIAMEKGSKVKHINEDFFHELKAILEKLHSFNIIHFDIKPQNIIYSHHYQKIVFIDFGFSKIINEKIGYKTLTTFRGTPKYCSEQMLKILNHHQPQYIDAYYNDLYSLKETYLNLQRKAFDQNGLSQNIFIPSDAVLASIHYQLELYLFQYHYLTQNINQLNKIVQYKNKRWIKAKIKQVLGFMLKVISYRFISDLFSKVLSQFSYLNEYQQIYRITQQKREKLSLFYLQQSSAPSEEKFHHHYRFYMNIQDSNYNFQSSFSFNIINNHELFDGENFSLSKKDFEIIFLYLRFDVKNIDISEKESIAAQFRKFIGEEMENITPPLQDIKYFFKYFLTKIILVGDLGEWEKRHFYDVVFQLLQLEVNVNQEIKQFNSKMKCKQNSIIQMAIFCFELEKMIELVWIINFNKETIGFYQNFYLIATQLFLQNQQEMINKSKPQNKQEENILNLIKMLKENMIVGKQASFLAEISTLIKMIKNKRLKYLMQLVYSKTYFKIKVDQFQHQEIITLVRSLLQNLNQTQLYFVMNIVKKYAIFLEVYNEIDEFNQKIKEIVSCPYIYQKLNLQKYVAMFQSNFDQDKCMTYLKDINDCYESLERIRLPVKGEIVMLLRKITPGTLRKSQMDMLGQLFQKFSQNIFDISQQVINQRAAFSIVLENVRILTIFKKIGFNLISISLDNAREEFIQYWQKAKSIEAYSRTERGFIIKTIIKCLLLFIQYYYDVQSQQDLIQPLIYLEKIYCSLHFYEAWFHALHKIVTYSNSCNRSEVLKEYIEKIYDLVNEKEQYLSYFFMPNKPWALYMPLAYFAKFNHPQKLYSLLKATINWASNNSLPSHIQIFIHNIDNFCRNYSKVFMYSTLNEFIPFRKIQTNPYIIIYYINTAFLESYDLKTRLIKCLTLCLDGLSRFAKRSVLVKYYFIITTFSHFTQRKLKYLYYRSGKRYIQAQKYVNFAKLAQREVQKYSSSKELVKDASIARHKLKYLKYN